MNDPSFSSADLYMNTNFISSSTSGIGAGSPHSRGSAPGGLVIST